MLDLYVNIKRLRKENRLSQEELAQKTGYTDRSSIAKIEKGEIDLPQSKIALFASALGVSMSELMGNTGLSAPVSVSTPADFFAPEEIELIEKYRVLDDYGKRNVEMILSNEFERCVQTDREGSGPISVGGSDAARAG